MRDPAPYASEEIRGVFIPVGDTRLLLPNAMVAEIIDYRESADGNELTGHDWWRGLVPWRQHPLPLVAFDALLGGEFTLPRRARIVVCNALSDDAEQDFIGIVSAGIPRLVLVHEANLEVLPFEAGDETRPIVARVRFNDQEALIPDMDRLEELVEEACSTAA